MKYNKGARISVHPNNNYICFKGTSFMGHGNPVSVPLAAFVIEEERRSKCLANQRAPLLVSLRQTAQCKLHTKRFAALMLLAFA